ncbi:MAG: primase-like DNA-binding domain-containing protein [Clostridiales bacterium]
MSQSVINATGRYEHDSNKTLLFIEDCLDEGTNYEERTSVVYNRYKSWCIENGQYAESMKNFKQSLWVSLLKLVVQRLAQLPPRLPLKISTNYFSQSNQNTVPMAVG